MEKWYKILQFDKQILLHFKHIFLFVFVLRKHSYSNLLQIRHSHMSCPNGKENTNHRQIPIFQSELHVPLQTTEQLNLAE